MGAGYGLGASTSVAALTRIKSSTLIGEQIDSVCDSFSSITARLSLILETYQFYALIRAGIAAPLQ